MDQADLSFLVASRSDVGRRGNGFVPVLLCIYSTAISLVRFLDWSGLLVTLEARGHPANCHFNNGKTVAKVGGTQILLRLRPGPAARVIYF
jgi:hypothetical protein